jgi:hypothetical protein
MSTQQDSSSERETTASRLYREIHGWPRLLGVPAHLAMGLLTGGMLGSFLSGLIGGDLLVGSVVLTTVLLWLLLAWLSARDQTLVPLFLVKRLRIALPRSLTSYSPSKTAVVIAEQAPAKGEP